MRPEDRRFIVPTWVRSFAEYAPWGPAATREHHAGIVDAILDDPATRVLVLASDEAARTLHAWAAGVGDVLHYVYVPPELRGHDLARRVMTAVLGGYPDRITVSHPWPTIRAGSVRRQHRRFRWSPYYLPSITRKAA